MIVYGNLCGATVRVNRHNISQKVIHRDRVVDPDVLDGSVIKSKNPV